MPLLAPAESAPGEDLATETAAPSEASWVDPNLAYVTGLLRQEGLSPEEVFSPTSGRQRPYLAEDGESSPSSPSHEPVDAFDYIGDTFKGLAVGASGALVETLNMPVDLINLVRDDDNQLEGLSNPLKEAFAPNTAWGRGVESVTQFALGMLGAGKALKAAKLLQGAGKAATVGRGMAQGAIADFTVFDGNEARLSNLVQHSAFANPVTDFLAAGEDDPAALGRLKNAIEGLGLGVVGEALVTALKGSKAVRTAKTIPEAEEAAIKTADELEELGKASGHTAEELTQAVDTVVLSGDSHTVSAVADSMAASVKEGGRSGDTVLRVSGEIDGKPIAEGLAPSSLPPAKAAQATDIPSPEEFGKILEKGLAAGKSTKEIFEQELLLGHGITFKTPEDANLMAAYSEVIWEKTLKGKGVETHAEVLRQYPAWVESQGLQGVLEEAGTVREVMEGLTKKLAAFEATAKTIGLQAVRLWEGLKLKGIDPAGNDEFRQLSRAYMELTLTSKNTGTAAGRALSFHRNKADYLPDDILMNVIKMADNDPEKITRVLNAHRNGGAFKTMTEIITNGLLSSPKTHAINIAGNIFKALLMPAEKMLGGRFMGDEAMVREGLQTYAGLRRYLDESFKMAKLAWKTGENLLDAGHKVADGREVSVLGTFDKVKADILDRKAARGDTSGRLSELEELQAHAFSWLGAPSRLLGAADEFFKQLNYRANVYAKLSGEAAHKFPGDAMKMGEYVENGMEAAFDKAGRGTREDALRIAQEATWTQPLRNDAYFNGGLGQAALNMVNGYPPLRLVMPFIRTPTNLIRDFVAHTPGLNMVTKRFRDAVQAGGERKAHALGQTATGALLWTSAVTLAASGTMTGGYPRDPATRQAWIDAGIEPYSFKVGDVYIPFGRLDPFSTFFGIAADMAEYTRTWSDSGKGNLAGGAVLALANNITSKSYLMGLVELMDALTDTTVNASQMEKFIRRSVTMLIPYSSGLRFSRQLTDDSLREVRGSLDAVLNTIPLGSRLLPERRSWLTGKAVSHNLFWGENNNDLVTNELARLGNGLRIGAPSKTLSGVELDGEQYSRLCELQGTITIGGKTLHEKLGAVMNSHRYDLDRERAPDMPGDMTSPRAAMVEDVIREYRQKAQTQLKRESPELQEALDRQWRTRVAARKGDVNRVQELLSMP